MKLKLKTLSNLIEAAHELRCVMPLAMKPLNVINLPGVISEMSDDSRRRFINALSVIDNAAKVIENVDVFGVEDE